MVDPISIACAVGSIVTTSAKVTKVLRRFISEAGNIDETFQSLLDEVRSLSTVSEEIEKRCKGNTGVLSRYAAEEEELWSAIEASIGDCKATLSKLDEVLRPLCKKRKFLSSYRRAMSLDWNGSSIIRFRQQLQTHGNAMQLGLSTILICLQSQSGEMDREILRKLDRQMSCLLEVKKSIERGGIYDQFATLNEKDGIVSKNLRQLTRETESFHGRSQSKQSIWNGSNIGDISSADRKERIPSWIQSNCEYEERPSISGEPRSNTKLEDAALREEDMHAPLIQAMLRDAVEHFENKDYLKVEGTLRCALQYCHEKQFILGDPSAINIMLGYVLALQEKWSDVEKELLPPAGQRIVTTDLVLTCDILALTCMNKNDFEAALDYCEQARKIKSSNKKDGAVYQSISLMAEIYQKKDVNDIMARAHLRLIPEDMRQSAGETKLHDSILSPLSESIMFLKRRLVSDEMVNFNSMNMDQRYSSHSNSLNSGFSAALATSCANDHHLHRIEIGRHNSMHSHTIADTTNTRNLAIVQSTAESDVTDQTLDTGVESSEVLSPDGSLSSSQSHRSSSTPTTASTISYGSQQIWVDASSRATCHESLTSRDRANEIGSQSAARHSSHSPTSRQKEHESRVNPSEPSITTPMDNINWPTALTLSEKFQEHRGSGAVKVAFSPHSNLLVSKISLGFSLWDLATGVKRFERGNSFFGESSVFADSISFSPDNKLLLTVENSVGGHKVTKWNTESDLAYRTPKYYKGNITRALLFPNGRRTALASSDGVVWIINTATGQIEKECKMHKKSIDCLALSSDGSLVASSSTEYTTKVWCTETDKQYSIPGHGKDIREISFSPTQRSLVALASNDCTVKLWDVASGKEYRSLVGHTDKVYSVAFAHNGNLIASGSRDCTIKLWDLTFGKCYHTIKLKNRVHSVALSPDGKLLASGESVRDEMNVKLWAGPFS